MVVSMSCATSDHTSVKDASGPKTLLIPDDAGSGERDRTGEEVIVAVTGEEPHPCVCEQAWGELEDRRVTPRGDPLLEVCLVGDRAPLRVPSPG